MWSRTSTVSGASWRALRSVRWLLLTISLSAYPQFTFVPFGETSPQAKTRDELDAFGKIYDVPEPGSIIRSAKTFIDQYPQSQFFEYAHLPLLHAYEQIGDSEKAKETAETVLRLNPHSVDALLSLAAYRLEHDSSGASEGLLPARQYAQNALERVEQFRLPVTANRTSWIQTKNTLLGKAHMLLALAAVQEKKLDEASDNLAMAAEFDPQGNYFYRLSLVYEATGRYKEALASAVRAQELGPGQVTRLAERAIERLRARPHAEK